MQSYKLCFFIVLFCTTLSCDNEDKKGITGIWEKESDDTTAISLKRDTVIKDIPVYKSGNFVNYYYDKVKIEKKMGLQTLEYGFDSLQIRIWYGHVFTNRHQLLILKKDEKQWEAYFGIVTIKVDTKSDSVVSVQNETDMRSPKSGWKKFIKDLFGSGILTLRDSQQVPGYAPCNDGDGVTIEVATFSKYRIYNYPCFNSQQRILEADNIENIMKLLEHEFDFKRIRP